MTLTATFKKYDSERVTGPRGGQKWVTYVSEVEDTLHPVTVSFNGVTKTLYTRGMDTNNDRKTLYEANGDCALGVWQHGRYGSKMHREGISIYKGRICSLESYASGQIKDQHKYLQSI